MKYTEEQLKEAVVSDDWADLLAVTQKGRFLEQRTEKMTGDTVYPAPRLSDETMPYHVSAYDMSMLGMYPWKPEGGDLTTRDLTLVKRYAYHKGIKTIYYTR